MLCFPHCFPGAWEDLARWRFGQKLTGPWPQLWASKLREEKFGNCVEFWISSISWTIQNITTNIINWSDSFQIRICVELCVQALELDLFVHLVVFSCCNCKNFHAQLCDFTFIIIVLWHTIRFISSFTGSFSKTSRFEVLLRFYDSFVHKQEADRSRQEEDTMKRFEAGALNSEKADGRLFLSGSRCYN